jgi:SAM-dependent methyltransferase
MKRTSERHHPDALLTAEDEAMDVRHRYAYSLVQRYATQGDRLLDVGSGEGYGAAIVSSWVTSYDGVDVSATAVAHAAKTYGAASVRFEHYDGRTLPYETDAFDLVVSFQVIEHVEDVDGYIQEMHRVARPGARVLVTTPNRLLRLADGERPWNRYHRRSPQASARSRSTGSEGPTRWKRSNEHVSPAHGAWPAWIDSACGMSCRHPWT